MAVGQLCTLSILMSHAELIDWWPEGPDPCYRRKMRSPDPRTRAAGWTEIDALAAMGVFEEKDASRHPGAAICLSKDRAALMAFHDFPARHRDHLRGSNPIESVFATVRHRDVYTRGALSHQTAKLMVLALIRAPMKLWGPKYEWPHRYC